MTGGSGAGRASAKTARDRGATGRKDGRKGDGWLCALWRWLCELWRWLCTQWRWTIPLLTVVATGLLFATAVVGDGLWELPGRSREQLRQVDWSSLPHGADLEGRLRLDLLLIVATASAICCGLMFAHAPKRTVSNGGDAARLGGLTAVVGYVVADIAENSKLELLVSSSKRLSDTSSGDARLLANFHNAKWLFLGAAIVFMLSTWGEPLPGRPGQKQTKGRPDDWWASDNLPSSATGEDKRRADTRDRFDTSGTPTDWLPQRRRLGISVSGGGVRSASFAFGVLQVLRREGLLERACYVTSVSGGGYTAAALEHENRTEVDTSNVAERAKTVDRIRRRLGYLVPTTVAGVGAVARVLLGLLINLWLIYLVMFAVLRPVSWLVGSPFVQSGLRLEQPYVIDVVSPTTDPDVAAGSSTWEKECGYSATKAAPTVGVITGQLDAGGAVEFALDQPDECVRVRDVDGSESIWTFAVCPDLSGILAIGSTAVTVERQPTLKVRDATRVEDAKNSPDPSCMSLRGAPDPTEDDDETIGAMVVLDPPDLEVVLTGRAIGPTTSITDVLGEPEPLDVEPVTIIDRRGELDVDRRHWVFGIIVLIVGLCAWGTGASAKIQRKIRNADDNSPWRHASSAPGALAGAAIGLLLLMFALPLLVKAVPEWLDDAAKTGPTADQLKPFGWIPAGIPPLAAWPILAIATVVQMITKRKPAAEKTSSKKRNAVAFAKKLTNIVTNIVIGLVLIGLVVFGASAIMATGALNGPFGDHAWFTRELFGWDLPWPADLKLWLIVVVGLLAARVVPAWSWSLGAYYRSRLRWAFRDDDPDAGSLIGDGPAGERANARAGRLYGEKAELVLCTAANVLGPDRAPTGRRAISLTASRSWVGAPELGWLPTERYLGALSRGNQDSVSIESLMALSGAAVSPAMGKQSLGPKGSVLAILNVRLGRWIPHPGAVKQIVDGTSCVKRWRHRPGWTYFIREVVRRYRHEAHYVYVTDGGHWENLGLVEALRRGCNHIVAISAAGDGAFSHATLAEAVELARTDLGIEIEMGEVWRMRSSVAEKPAERLPSGRQYLLQDGDQPSLGVVSEFGFTSGTFRRRAVDPPHDTGTILLIEATMVDELPIDVHAYAESHHEFPDVSTGDQFFINRDFESYRMLGRVLAEDALESHPGRQLLAQLGFRLRPTDRTVRARVLRELDGTAKHSSAAGSSPSRTVAELSIATRQSEETVVRALADLASDGLATPTEVSAATIVSWKESLAARLVQRAAIGGVSAEAFAWTEGVPPNDVDLLVRQLRAAEVLVPGDGSTGDLALTPNYRATASVMGDGGVPMGRLRRRPQLLELLASGVAIAGNAGADRWRRAQSGSGTSPSAGPWTG